MNNSYKSATKVLPATMKYGNWPKSPMGNWDPATETQFNATEREYWSDGFFSGQMERQMSPCPNGRGQACKDTRLSPNQGGANLPKSVNSTFLGSQTNIADMGFRPDYNALLLDGSMTRAAAYQLVSQEAFDGSLDGSYAFCQATCPAVPAAGVDLPKHCGWCVQPPIAKRDPGTQL